MMGGMKPCLLLVLIFMITTAAAGLFGAPKQIHAQGSLVRGSLPAVYFVDAKNRYAFPNEAIYFSWFADFSSVATVTDAELARYQLVGNITYRPGTRLVKLTNDPRVYAVEAGGILHWLTTESVAAAVFGSDWNKRVDDLPDSFFPSYALGDPFVSVYQAKTSLLFDETDSRFLNPAQTGLGMRLGHDVMAELIPTQATILQGAGDQVLGRFTISMRKPTDVARLDVSLKAETNADADFDAGGLIRGDGVNQIEGNVTRLRLLDETGAPFLSDASLSLEKEFDGAQTVSFTGARTFLPGRHTITLVADTSGAVPVGERYQATLVLSSADFKTDGLAVVDVNPARLSASTVTVKSGALEVAVGSAAKTQFVLRGTATVSNISAFTFSNPLAEPAAIHKVTLTGYIDANEGNPDFQPGADEDGNRVFANLRDVVASVSLVRVSDGAVLAASNQVQANGEVAFENINWIVPAHGSLDVAVSVALNPSAPYGEQSDRVAFDIADASRDVDATIGSGLDLNAEGLRPNGGANPGTFLSIAESGTLKIAASGSTPPRVVMGSKDQALSQFTFTASKEEPIGVDSLAVRLTDPSGASAVSFVTAQFALAGSVVRRTASIHSGNAVFHDLGLVVPKDGKVVLDLFVDVGTSQTGAVSGSRIGCLFDATAFEAHGADSGYRFAEKDIGHRVTNGTGPGGSAVVRKNVPFVAKSATLPAGSQFATNLNPLFRFTMRAVGEGSATVKKLTFKIVSSDVGTAGANNDLLEVLSGINGDAPDDNGVGELVDLETGKTLGEGADGHIDYAIYDASNRTVDVTPLGLETGSGDYGLLTYTFATPIVVSGTDREYEWSLDARGLAAGLEHITVTLLGGDDFAWSDGTASGNAETGVGVDRLPVIGSTIRFD